MNKILSIILTLLALALIGYNSTLVSFENPLKGNSLIALIGIAACLCAIVLLLIYITSKKIQQKIEEDE